MTSNFGNQNKISIDVFLNWHSRGPDLLFKVTNYFLSEPTYCSFHLHPTHKMKTFQIQNLKNIKLVLKGRFLRKISHSRKENAADLFSLYNNLNQNMWYPKLHGNSWPHLNLVQFEKWMLLEANKFPVGKWQKQCQTKFCADSAHKYLHLIYF